MILGVFFTWFKQSTELLSKNSPFCLKKTYPMGRNLHTSVFLHNLHKSCREQREGRKEGGSGKREMREK